MLSAQRAQRRASTLREARVYDTEAKPAAAKPKSGPPASFERAAKPARCPARCHEGEGGGVARCRLSAEERNAARATVLRYLFKPPNGSAPAAFDICYAVQRKRHRRKTRSASDDDEPRPRTRYARSVTNAPTRHDEVCRRL